MALTANAIPSQIPSLPVPYDAMTAFCSAQTVTASGFIAGNVQTTIDLGGPSPVSAAGRTDAILTMDITAINMATSDESYTFRLCGSNDATFANGNVELLAMHDFAATAALRNLANVLGVTPAIPPTGRAGSVIHIPFTNLMQGIVYRYLRLNLQVVGTGPSVTLTAWVSKAEIKF